MGVLDDEYSSISSFGSGSALSQAGAGAGGDPWAGSFRTFSNNTSSSLGGSSSSSGIGGVPQIKPGGSAGMMDGGLFSMDGLNVLMNGIGVIGNTWNAFEARKLAKEQFKTAKEFAQKNLTNSVKSYNTTLADRARSRYHTEGASQEAANAYVEQNKLTD